LGSALGFYRARWAKWNSSQSRFAYFTKVNTKFLNWPRRTAYKARKQKQRADFLTRLLSSSEEAAHR
jgi:hypothetical protein